MKKSTRRKWNLAVLVSVVLGLAAIGVGVLFFLSKDQVSWINQRIDLGGALSFAVTVVIIAAAVVLKYGDFGNAYGKLEKNIEKSRLSLTVSTIAITLVGLVALWLAVRVTLLFAERYILSPALLSGFSPKIDSSIEELEDLTVYLPENVFLMVSYALIANLCFTLARTFLTIGRPIDIPRELISVAIQAVLIGFITLVPRVSDVLFFPRDPSIQAIERLIKMTGFVFIMIAMIVSVLVLLYSRERLDRLGRQPEPSE